MSLEKDTDESRRPTFLSPSPEDFLLPEKCRLLSEILCRQAGAENLQQAVDAIASALRDGIRALSLSFRLQRQKVEVKSSFSVQRATVTPSGIPVPGKISFSFPDGGEGVLEWLSEDSDYSSLAHHLLQFLIGDLAVLLGGMVRREQQQLELQHRIDDLRHIPAALCHDMNNALAGLVAGVELGRPDFLRSGLSRVLEMVRIYESLSRSSDIPYVDECLHQFVVQVMEGLTAQIQGKKILIQVSSEGRCEARVNSGLIRSALENLLLNAIRYTEPGGKIMIHVSREYCGDQHRPSPDMPDGEFIHVMFEDHGPGIPEEIRARLFTRQVSTRGPDHGMGLRTVYTTVTRFHHGFLSFETKTGESSFTRFHIFLPALPEPLGSVAPPRLEHNGPDSTVEVLSGRQVLVCDDEAMVVDLFRLVFFSAGAKVDSCDDPGQVSLAVSHLPVDSMVLLDVNFCGSANGFDLAQKIRQQRPEIAIVLCSGDHHFRQVAEQAGFGFVPKPCDLSVIKSVAAAALLKCRKT